MSLTWLTVIVVVVAAVVDLSETMVEWEREERVWLTMYGQSKSWS